MNPAANVKYQNKKADNGNQVTELNVFVVPPELWLEKYRIAYNNVLDESTSAGFIRVSSHSTLLDIRRNIIDQLGNAVVPDRYVYLRSVGRCMAMVNECQESILSAKDFLPPQTLSPELFLLPGAHNEISQATNRSSTFSKISSGFGSPTENLDFSTLVFPLSSERNAVPENNAIVHHSYSKVGNVYKINKNNNSESSQYASPQGDNSSCSQCSQQIKNEGSDSKNSNNEHHASSSGSHASTASSLQPDIAFIPATPDKDLNPPIISPRHHKYEDVPDNELSGTLTRQERRALKIHQKKSNLKNIHKKLLQENIQRSSLYDSSQEEAYQGSVDKDLRTALYVESGHNTKFSKSNASTQFSSHENDNIVEGTFGEELLQENSSEKIRRTEIEAKIKARYEQEMMNLETELNKNKNTDWNKNNRDMETNMADGSTSPLASPENYQTQKIYSPRNAQSEKLVLMTENDMDHMPAKHIENTEQSTQLSPKVFDRIDRRRLDTIHSMPSFDSPNHAQNINKGPQRIDGETQSNDNENDLERTTPTKPEITENIEVNLDVPINKSIEKLDMNGRQSQGTSPRLRIVEINEEDVLSKIKEIEEIKKQKKENKKKKQIEDEEKHQNELEAMQKKKNRIDELKREIEKVKQDKHDFMKSREGYIKKQRHLAAELNAKQNQVNNVWRKKYLEERKKTSVLEDAVRKLNKDIQDQHRKLLNSSTRGHSGNFPVGFRANGNPSERTNQRNMVSKLQSENEDLKLRVDLAAKKLAAETKMKAFVQQEVKDLRSKAIKSKINVAKYNKK